jgi:hypothetical protein
VSRRHVSVVVKDAKHDTRPSTKVRAVTMTSDVARWSSVPTQKKHRGRPAFIAQCFDHF